MLFDFVWTCSSRRALVLESESHLLIGLFLLKHASSDVERMILGNKCDMNDKRQVSKARGEQVGIRVSLSTLILVISVYLLLIKDCK